MNCATHIRACRSAQPSAVKTAIAGFGCQRLVLSKNVVVEAIAEAARSAEVAEENLKVVG
jgi:hypothetical protein